MCFQEQKAAAAAELTQVPVEVASIKAPDPIEGSDSSCW
jgi:hypothetical protein